jgi:mannose-6-phosphate isomerase-like protein (cupin superfamily)
MKEVEKPWGSFKQFIFNKKCTIKILIVHPHQELSLQKHKKRKETWFFLTPGYLQIGKKKTKVKKGKLIKVNINVAHRLFAKRKRVEVLEISEGQFSEKDVIRLEDKYGRK